MALIEDTFLIESHHYKTRPEKLTTEEEKKFNLLTKTKEEVWEIVIFIMTYRVQGRYVSHEIIEKFIPIHSLKRKETGTVQYFLNVKYLTKY